MAALSAVPSSPNQRREGQPLRSLSRHDRRRAAMIKRRSLAVRPLEQLAIALDYFRSVAADHSLEAVQIDRAVRQTTTDLIQAADRLAATRRVR